MIIARIIAVAIGYACGLFETGYFYGKKKGVDIRTKGSGNSGATNTLRTFGWKAGLVTCLGDILKTVAAVLAVKLIFGRTYTEDIILLELYAGFGAVLGHNFPFYLKFKGRKRSCMYRWNGACSISDRCTGQYGTFSGDQRSDKVCISRLDHRTDQCFRPGGYLRTAWDYHSSNGNPCGILHSDSLFYHFRGMAAPCKYQTSCKWHRE